jgi:hypothetical protein
LLSAGRHAGSRPGTGNFSEQNWGDSGERDHWYGCGRNIYYPGLLREGRDVVALPATPATPHPRPDDDVYRLRVLRDGEFIVATQPGTVVLPGQLWDDNTRLTLTDDG